MSLYKKLVGSHRREADAILKLRSKILNGHLLSIDPGSNSLGFALFRGFDLVKSGSITAKGTVGQRLHLLMTGLQAEFAMTPDVVLVEKVRTATGHIYLTWAAGAAVAAIGAEHTIEVTTGAWKRAVSEDYEKSDENDAIAIGNFAVTLCKEAAKARKGRRGNSKLRRARRKTA